VQKRNKALANANPASNSHSTHSAPAEAAGAEKHERIARESLRSMVMFSETLESEMHRMKEDDAKGLPIDRSLLDKMTIVKDKYRHVMTGFMALGDDEQRHALIVFADAVQDIVKHLHTGKH